MVTYNATKATTTDFTNNITNYSVDTVTTDGPTGVETSYINSKAAQWLAYYKKIPIFKNVVSSFANWCVGQGYQADSITAVRLENIRGWGEDTFNAILWNMIVCKKVYGDAFAEIIRDDKGHIQNLKILDPGSIKIIVDKNGILDRYEQISKTYKPVKTFQPDDIFHLCNERIADEIHGTSVLESVEWVILAIHEAMTDWRKVLHRNIVPVRIIEVDTNDTTTISSLKTQYETTIKDAEVLIIPKGTISITTDQIVINNPIEWIKQLEDYLYRSLGVPKVAVGGTQESTEASAKVGVMVYEPIYTKEIMELEADLWSQLQIRIKINKQPSIMSNLQSDQAKNTGQTGFQPNDAQAIGGVNNAVS